MAPIGVIKSYPENPRVAKAKIAAAYNGVEIDVSAFDLQKDRTPEFMAKFPLGKVPTFESAEVDLFESSAIAYYAAALKEDSTLLGSNAVEKALIMQWTLFAENEINTNVGAWVYPLLGFYPYIKPNVDAATEKVKRAMDALNKILLTKTYLVGESITFADIAVVCALVLPYKTVFDKEFRSQYKNVSRYFTTVVGKEHFKAALGEIALCETPLKYTPPKKEKKETKKEAAPKKEEKKKEAAAPAEEAAKPAPKPKSKLDLLPPSKFIMDEWKRMYSNNDTDVAMKWFWENHDAEGYSLWRVDYKYNDELTLVFMSCNLIGGFFARLEMARKYAFGSLVVCGENNNNTISGYFLIRGQEVPFEVYDAADYDSYNFTKIEPAQYEEKKEEIYKYMAWEVEGFQDGKIFK
ncbi:Elongation factor 1-gamma [Apophysomyces ossiformis]|uniref:Elongation factor 1-gamma n=1 Tax=Apophysomyces ossiformis TaxID=679940 RepID=A0A8H7BX44_9FUNG|nr:Elongation factor 1-gamma [Apophysomyces ossiformis]